MWRGAVEVLQGAGEPINYCSASGNVVRKSPDGGFCRMHWDLKFSYPFGGMLLHLDESLSRCLHNLCPCLRNCEREVIFLTSKILSYPFCLCYGNLGSAVVHPSPDGQGRGSPCCSLLFHPNYFSTASNNSSSHKLLP